VFLFAVLAAGCQYASPDQGQEAVLVRKPWFFGHGGVDPTPVKTGTALVAASTNILYVPTTPIQFQEHFEDLMSSDGVPLDFDTSLNLIITDTVKMAERFGVNDVGNGSRPWPAWYANNVSQPFRNLVRQEVRNHGMNETAISSVAIEAIDKAVSDKLVAYLKQIELPVTLRDMTVGRANPPDSIKNQRTETATQEQRANTEKQRKLAEDQRLAAEQARAAADNAYRGAMNLTPEQFVQLQNIQMQGKVCAEGRCTFVVGAGTALVNTR
jgi:hypothetical protein